MNTFFINLANAGLQTIATGLIVAGSWLIYSGSRLWDGIALAIIGVVCYMIYEYFPSKQ